MPRINTLKDTAKLMRKPTQSAFFSGGRVLGTGESVPKTSLKEGAMVGASDILEPRASNLATAAAES